MGDYFQTNMMKMLPPLYEREDEKEDLQGFLKVLATEMDAVKDLIDGMVDLIDVDACPAKFLPYLGVLLDYEWDYTRPTAEQRKEIANLIEVYRRRGSIPGTERKTRLAGYAGSVIECWPLTMRLGAQGRGLRKGIKLSGRKYNHAAYIVSLWQIVRNIREIIADEHPAGTVEFFIQRDVILKTIEPMLPVALTGDSWRYCTDYFLPYGSWCIWVDGQDTVGSDLLDNGGFEGTYVGGVAPDWTSAGPGPFSEDSGSHGGSKCQKISGAGSLVKQWPTLALGKWYRLVVWAKGDSGNSATIRVRVKSSPTEYRTILDAGELPSTWTRYSGLFYLYDTPNVLELLCNNANAVYFDDAELIEVEIEAEHEFDTRLPGPEMGWAKWGMARFRD